MLPETAQKMLKAVAWRRNDRNFTENHPHLDSVIAKIRAMYPDHFQSEMSLHQRVFVDEPRNRIPGTWLIDRIPKSRSA